MPEASNQQMQTWGDQRQRVRAEQMRNLLALMLDDKASIDDIYARGAGSNAWSDARSDGPPHLLQSGNSANPDDMLNYNAFLSSMKWLLTGAGAGDVAHAGGTAAQFQADVQAQYATLLRSCVRPVIGG